MELRSVVRVVRVWSPPPLLEPPSDTLRRRTHRVRTRRVLCAGMLHSAFLGTGGGMGKLQPFGIFC